MSKRIENQCVNCGLPCKSDLCRFRKVEVYYCDGENCNNEADYQIEDEHFCESCANEIIKETFNNLTLSEQAEAVDINLNKINQ